MPYQDYFRLKSPLASVFRQSLPVSDRLLLDFESTVPLAVVMGEWMTRDANYKLARAANPGVPPGPWVVFDELGRGDTQAIAAGKLTVLFHGTFWAETRIFTGAPTLGQALEVEDCAALFGGTRSGLGAHAGGANPIIGYCTKLAADNGGWLEFQTCLY